jgi:hypothetical protein
MRVVYTITTPWAPYSVMFSRDGTRLAIDGGPWYSNGGILLVNLISLESRLFPCANLPAPGRRLGPFTVSGVYFSPDDRHLAASTWSWHRRVILAGVGKQGTSTLFTLGSERCSIAVASNRIRDGPPEAPPAFLLAFAVPFAEDSAWRAHHGRRSGRDCWSETRRTGRDRGRVAGD